MVSTWTTTSSSCQHSGDSLKGDKNMRKDSSINFSPSKTQVERDCGISRAHLSVPLHSTKCQRSATLASLRLLRQVHFPVGQSVPPLKVPGRGTTRQSCSPSRLLRGIPGKNTSSQGKQQRGLGTGRGARPPSRGWDLESSMCVIWGQPLKHPEWQPFSCQGK